MLLFLTYQAKVLFLHDRAQALLPPFLTRLCGHEKPPWYICVTALHPWLHVFLLSCLRQSSKAVHKDPTSSYLSLRGPLSYWIRAVRQIENSRGDGVWFLRLSHKRHCSFWFGLLNHLLQGKPDTILWGPSSSAMEMPMWRRTNLPGIWMRYLRNTSSRPSQVFRWLQFWQIFWL